MSVRARNARPVEWRRLSVDDLLVASAPPRGLLTAVSADTVWSLPLDETERRTTLVGRTAALRAWEHPRGE